MNDNQIMKTEEMKKEPGNKKLHLIYISVITLLLIGIGAGVFFVNKAYREAVADSRKEYETAKAEFDKAYDRILEEEKDWKAELNGLQSDLNSANAELTDIYTARTLEREKEQQRWDALSEEEKTAETMCNKYNEMVSDLRRDNEEYAQLYVQYALYLNQDIFHLDKASLLQYTDLYNRKMQIEKQYMDALTF